MSLMNLHVAATQKLHADIALSRDEASRYLPWIIALMVYLAALILAGSFTLDSTIKATHRAQAESFSVHLPFMAGDQEAAEKVLDVVKNTPGVVDAEVVNPGRIEAMVEPWFGKSASLANLPLPTIIDAKTAKDAAINYDDLSGRIRLLVPAASIDDHKQWMSQFSAFISIVRTTLLLIAMLIILATACAVIFACKTSLKIHRGTVTLLHRLGAMDGYIATQFQNHAAYITLKGAFIGSGFAAFTLLGLHVMAHHIDSPLFPAFAFSLWHWFILFTLPLFMSLLALVVARVSVLGKLRKMP